MRVLVTGGARSGKSRYALGLAESLGTDRLFVATAEARDAEMAERIQAHRRERGGGWTTIEEPCEVAALVARAEVVLIDCLTLWVSNLMLRNGPATDLTREFERLAVAVARAENQVVLVTNEVGLGIVPDNALARQFRDHAGHLAQLVARACDRVVLMCAGIPLDIKRPA
jgi:adenosylcobinamide kinase/adenosylcobinamide-phosphate guanylyltransferase